VHDLRTALDDRRGRMRYDERAQPRPFRLVVGHEAPVVADQRVGHHDHLAGVGRVRTDLLIAGLARVDDEVAARRERCAERDPMEHRAVLECQQRRTAGADPRIDGSVGGQRQHQMRA
jgi:hypothetical protein